MPLLKNGFLEKIETCHVGLSCQYTHLMSFSSKSKHDTVADQATLNMMVMHLWSVSFFHEHKTTISIIKYNHLTTQFSIHNMMVIGQGKRSH